MNKNEQSWSHASFRQFIRKPGRFKEAKNDFPELLIQIVIRAQEQAGDLDFKDLDADRVIDRTVLDRIMQSAVAHTLSSPDAMALLYSLYHSPVLFQHGCSTCRFAEKSLRGDKMDVPDPVHVMSDKELMRHIRKFSGRQWPLLDKMASGFRSVFQPGIRVPVRWGRVTALGAAAVSLMFLWHHWLEQPSGPALLCGQHVPAAYELSGMRSDTPAYGGSSELQAFVIGFKSAMSDYVNAHYQEAARTLDDLENQNQHMFRSVPDSLELFWIREFYFYRAMCSWAQCRHGRCTALYDRTRNDLTEALKRSECLGTGYDARELFFLGLFYAVHRDIERAAVYLNRIPAGSSFFEEARTVLRSIPT
ncbi:hypothetical protein JW948_13810 [bacterium]|nr:hypothetical protein [bacterium]